MVIPLDDLNIHKSVGSTMQTLSLAKDIVRDDRTSLTKLIAGKT